MPACPCPRFLWAVILLLDPTLGVGVHVGYTHDGELTHPLHDLHLDSIVAEECLVTLSTHTQVLSDGEFPRNFLKSLVVTTLVDVA